MRESSFRRAPDGKGFVAFFQPSPGPSGAVWVDLVREELDYSISKFSSPKLTSRERRALARRGKKRRDAIPVSEWRPIPPPPAHSVTLHRHDYRPARGPRVDLFLAGGDALSELDLHALEVQTGPYAGVDGRGWYFIVERDACGILATPALLASCREEVNRLFNDRDLMQIDGPFETEDKAFAGFQSYALSVARHARTRYHKGWMDAQDAKSAARRRGL